MNDNQTDELKQFIATLLTQQTTDLREDIDDLRNDVDGLRNDVKGLRKDVDGLRKDFNKLEGKVDDLSHSVAEALDNSNDETAKRFDDHESRIGKLEANAA